MITVSGLTKKYGDFIAVKVGCIAVAQQTLAAHLYNARRAGVIACPQGYITPVKKRRGTSRW